MSACFGKPCIYDHDHGGHEFQPPAEIILGVPIVCAKCGGLAADHLDDSSNEIGIQEGEA